MPNTRNRRIAPGWRAASAVDESERFMWVDHRHAQSSCPRAGPERRRAEYHADPSGRLLMHQRKNLARHLAGLARGGEAVAILLRFAHLWCKVKRIRRALIQPGHQIAIRHAAGLVVGDQAAAVH